MSNIHIGEVKMHLNDFVVSRNAILGITKSGKTYTAKGVAEQLLEHKVPIIVFDPIGVWRYLKVPAKRAGGKGFQVVVAGGSHPDLPLTPHSAPEIVRAAIRENIPLIIDLYDAKLSKADWRRIVQDCFRILLYENKGLRHIFLEEAAEYAPQKVMDGQTYAEVEKLARMGGNASLGITFINQRAQELNKAVLELCDNIILLRQRGTHAIDSLEKQMDKLSPDMAVEIAKSMPHMTQGDCWIFTENDETPVRTRSGLIKSFHPDRRNPDEKQIAQTAVDTGQFVAALSGKLEKVIAEAKANDPTALKNKVKQLEAELKKKQVSTPIGQLKSETKIVNVPALTDAERKRLTKLISACDSIDARKAEMIHGQVELTKSVNAVLEEAQYFKNLLAGKLLDNHGGRSVVMQRTKPIGSQPNMGRVERLPAAVHRPRPEPIVGANGELPTGGLRRMLIALAQRPGLSARQLGVRAGLSSTSGSFNTYLSKGRSCGWLAGDRNRMEATPDGVAAIGIYDPLPEGQDLLEHWLRELGQGGAGRILDALAKIYPDTITKDQLGAATGLSHNSGSFNTYLSKLRTLELIEGSNPLKASDEFFQ